MSDDPGLHLVASALMPAGSNNPPPEQALADYGTAIQFDPNHADAYRHRGRLQERCGQFDSARTDYERALALSDDVRVKETLVGPATEARQ